MKFARALVVILISLPAFIFAQTKEEIAVEKIYKQALTNGKSYELLRELCYGIGARPSGSPQAAAAVEWGRQQLENAGADRVWLQDVMVPYWVRGEKEEGRIISTYLAGGWQSISICALGGSVATEDGGLTAEVVEVSDFNALKKLGKKAKGRIVFFNRPMDASELNTFEAYGGAVNQRGLGAAEATKYGAVAVIVRSMTLASDHSPHTGAMRWEYTGKRIPAAAVSTKDADLLSELIKKDKNIKVFIRMNPEMRKEVKSYNVIGEIKGSEYPNEVIVIGAHLDSWDLGQGAHDDGAGVVQCIEVIRMFKDLRFKPKRTIRVVLYMNEEFGLKGGLAYADSASKSQEKHIAAVESDAGGTTPHGFSIDSSLEVVSRMAKWKDVLGKYGIYTIEQGHGGADIGPLKKLGALPIGLRVDSQRYFDYHHSENDTFDKVNKRELELGGAAMASMAYLLAEFGVE